MYLNYACNVFLSKKRIEGTLRPILYVPTLAAGSRSHDRYRVRWDKKQAIQAYPRQILLSDAMEVIYIYI